jgi:uncharacterized protein (DUF433 family)
MVTTVTAVTELAAKEMIWVDIDVELAISRRQIQRITGVKLSTVDYWTRTGLVDPEVHSRIRPGTVIRHYGYLDVMALLVIRELRDRKVSLQNIRSLVGSLRREGFTKPLTEINYAVVGGKVFIQLPSGEWMDGRNPGQGIIQQTLPLAPLRASIRSRLIRPSELAGRTERRRGALGSKPLVAGTRIPVATLHRYLAAGRTADQIITSFPALTVTDIDAARRSMVA